MLRLEETSYQYTIKEKGTKNTYVTRVRKTWIVYVTNDIPWFYCYILLFEFLLAILWAEIPR